MQGSWNHNRPYYRCKFPAEYAIAKDQHPKTIYIREDSLTPAIDQWLAQLFDDDHIDETCAALEAASGPDLAEHNQLAAARKKLKECDDKLAKYRRALEANADPAIVGGWIEEVKLARKAAENHTPTKNLRRTTHLNRNQRPRRPTQRNHRHPGQRRPRRPQSRLQRTQPRRRLPRQRPHASHRRTQRVY